MKFSNRMFFSAIILMFTMSVCAQEKKVVFIIVDGIADDMLPKTSTPNLDEIASVGFYSQAYVGGRKGGYSETPTISAVGYNSLITGTWVNKHNVFGNSIKEPNYNYPTIYQLFEKVWPEKQTAIFSTWLDNRTKLIGEGLPKTGEVKIDYAFDGFELDTIAFPHDPEREFIKNIDEKVATEAARYIKEKGPDLSWVYLEYSDDMGHMFGDSPQLYKAITFEDALIGKIWNSVKSREQDFNEEWLILITTDHGRSESNGKHHGGQSDRERSTWVISNDPTPNEYFKKDTIAIVDLLPTMADFMGLPVDKKIRWEWDGVSLASPVTVVNLEGKFKEDCISLNWDVISSTSSKGKLYLTSTNKVKEGGEDTYKYVGEVNLKDGEYCIPISGKPAAFYKVVLETSDSSLNTWIIKD